MPLPPPNDKDLAKLHGEVNQYINQRFVIATTAITITGVVLGWVVQAPQGRKVAFFLGLVLLVILAMLLVVSQAINASASIITSYLRKTKASIWEESYKNLLQARASVYHNVKGPKQLLKIIFGILGLLAGFTPVVLAYSLWDVWVLVMIVATFGYERMVYLVTEDKMLNFGASESDKLWECLEKSKYSGDRNSDTLTSQDIPIGQAGLAPGPQDSATAQPT